MSQHPVVKVLVSIQLLNHGGTMNRETFKAWMEETYKRKGLLAISDAEADAEYELLTLEEEEDEWLSDYGYREGDKNFDS